MKQRFLSARFIRHRIGIYKSIDKYHWCRLTFELAVKIAGGPSVYKFWH